MGCYHRYNDQRCSRYHNLSFNSVLHRTDGSFDSDGAVEPAASEMDMQTRRKLEIAELMFVPSRVVRISLFTIMAHCFVVFFLVPLVAQALMLT